MKFFFNIAVISCALLGCYNAKFSSDGAKAPAAVPSVTPLITPIVTPIAIPMPSPTPSDIPVECQNTIATQGVFDNISKKTFKLLTQQYSYDAGIAACQAWNASAKMIYQGQDLSDKILACRKALGTLWMRADASSLALWQPGAGGVEDPSARHWIICYY